MVKKTGMMSSAKKGCTCSMGKMLFGVVLMAAGLVAVVAGFQQQDILNNIGVSLLYYIVGIFLICVGKFFKMSSYMCCEAHNMCK